MSFDNTRDCLLSLLSKALFQKPYSLSDGIDFKELFKESKNQTVSSLVFSTLEKDKVPQKIYDTWELKFNMDLLVNSRVSYGHSLVHKLLSSDGIDYVILKGCVSASYYESYMLRNLGDVDFLVRPCDFEKAKRILAENGFTYVENNHEYEVEFDKDGVVYELHKRINGIPQNKIGSKIEKLFDDIFDRAQLESSEFATYMSPSVFHHGLIMLLHDARHMITGGIGLRHLCDWAVFVDSVSDFEATFKEKLESVGLWNFAIILTQLSITYLGCPEKEWAKNKDAQLLEALKDDIFAGGNFGKKDLKRADQAKFITSRRDGAVTDKNNFSQAVISANEIVRRHWKWAGKVPVVYPFGWIYYGAKYGIKTIFGKRDKKDISALISGADKRKEIYKELRLFE